MRAYERLLEYVKYPTVSDPNSDTCPSTPEQLEFGRVLVREMQELGITDANMDENGFVFGTIPATKLDARGPVIGFLAHLDVSEDAPCHPVNARIVKNYDGGDIALGNGIVMSPSEFSSLEKYVGDDLIVSDGNTLLGCDNKCGIATIMAMAEYFHKNPHIEHGAIKIGFTPDEEIGTGIGRFDVERFGADFAYTVDGGAFGEVEYETFNASSAIITINGVSMHPGMSKNKMKNASLIALEFARMLPEAEKPEYTENYEGFYHLLKMKGVVEKAELEYILRDHDEEKLKIREKFMHKTADFLNYKYGVGTVEVKIEESYRNMESVLRNHWHLIDNAYKAVEQVGGVPYSVPVRGGTDGSRLSYTGLPCPNLGAGCHNAHSRTEYASVQAMDKVAEALVALAVLYTDFEI